MSNWNCSTAKVFKIPRNSTLEIAKQYQHTCNICKRELVAQFCIHFIVLFKPITWQATICWSLCNGVVMRAKFLIHCMSNQYCKRVRGYGDEAERDHFQCINLDDVFIINTCSGPFTKYAVGLLSAWTFPICQTNRCFSLACMLHTFSH